MPLISCLCTGKREIEFYVAFLKKLICFFCLVMGRAGQGPPNSTVPGAIDPVLVDVPPEVEVLGKHQDRGEPEHNNCNH